MIIYWPELMRSFETAAGARCDALEVYRVSLGADGSVAHPLDYPGSKVVPGSAANHQVSAAYPKST